MGRHLLRSKGYNPDLVLFLSLAISVLINCQGPYAPAVLRFHVSFPENYPNQPLLVVFKTDIFHPLVTPLTTYMAGTLTAASGSTTSDDHVPLPPGGFSLRFAFPRWFRKPQKEASLRSIESRSASELSTKLDPLENGSPGPCSPAPISKSDPVFLDQGKGMASYITSKAQDEPLYDVLLYMKSAFEDESVIDALPLDAASNSGAWHAWQAHRRKVQQYSFVKYSSNPLKSATSKAHDATRLVESSPGSRPKVSTEWNWDGVWLGRVKKGVDASISESVLYGTTDGDDEVWSMNSFPRFFFMLICHRYTFSTLMKML